MSQENVEIVKLALDFLGRRDWPGIMDADLIDPNVELHGSVGASRKAKSCVAPPRSVRPSIWRTRTYGMSTGSSRESSSMPATGWSSSTASTSAVRAAASRS